VAVQRFDTAGAAGFFDVLGGTERSQAATMTLDPGRSTGGPTNAHGASDQWLYVVSGTGTAIVEGERYDLEAGTLVLVEAGETHEITNTGTDPLETINVYAPPEY
jgi:mannose-6-phosphate isomerase-like protein (cupin superfamily)